LGRQREVPDVICRSSFIGIVSMKNAQHRNLEIISGCFVLDDIGVPIELSFGMAAFCDSDGRRTLRRGFIEEGSQNLW
jgi:hypothetical protein